MSHTELKQTWKLANEQFLDQQTKLFFELEQTKKLLTAQQLEHVSKEVRRYSAAKTQQQQQQQKQQQLQHQQQQQQKIKSQRELLGEFDVSKKKTSSPSLSSKSSHNKKAEKEKVRWQCHYMTLFCFVLSTLFVLCCVFTYVCLKKLQRQQGDLEKYMGGGSKMLLSILIYFKVLAIFYQIS